MLEFFIFRALHVVICILDYSCIDLVGIFTEHIVYSHNYLQKTHLLDEENTDQLPCLELKGIPSISLPEDLVHFPHSSEAVELSCDNNLRVTLRKVWKPNELVLVVFLTNQNQVNAPIHDVTSVFEPPSNLISSFDSLPSNKLQDEKIGPLEWVRT